ncbi:unnamed protein product, partial [marine sediment metagenome]
MSEVKIARFVGIEACKSIFSEKSTFVLRSPEYYRRLYETSEGETDKGDRNEGYASTTDGGTAGQTDWVASCWTILDEDEDKPTSDDWDIFKKNDQNIVAIVSTPSRVCEFLDKTFETYKEKTDRKFPFDEMEHREVEYEKLDAIDKSLYGVPFTKELQFVKQKEYRFVLRCKFPNIIDSLIFYGEGFFASTRLRLSSKHSCPDLSGLRVFESKPCNEVTCITNNYHHVIPSAA